MKAMFSLCCFMLTIFLSTAQDYYFSKFKPFNPEIPEPAEFLGYDIGDYHTRHDRIVAYLEELARVSDRASLIDYGKTHELRRLVMLQISTADNLANIERLRTEHLKLVDPNID